MTRLLAGPVAVATIALVVACSRDDRQSLDTAGAALESAAGAIASDVRAELAVLDIDMGRRAGVDHEVTEEMETFAPSDTIYASVNTTGTVRPGAITARWTLPDASVISQEAKPPTRERDANLLFFLTKDGGLNAGEYTFALIVDGKEVRSQKVTVR